MLVHFRTLHKPSLLGSRSLQHRHALKQTVHRRTFMQGLCNEFLELAIALPVPAGWPPYSTSIILATLASRFALLPVSIWAKKRAWRLREDVLPKLKQMEPALMKSVVDEMKAQGIRGKVEDLRQYHQKRVTQLLTARQKELIKEYNCSPRMTMIAPVVSQLPVFVLLTSMLNRLSISPSPFDSESFLTLTSLSHPDPTMFIPIAIGVVTMANVESATWMMSSAELALERQAKEKEAQRIAEGGKPRIQVKGVLQGSMRVLSIVRIVFASMFPGSVGLYWLTSATFGLFQTLAMDWVDRRRLRALPPPLPVLESTPAPLASQRTSPIQAKSKLRRR